MSKETENYQKLESFVLDAGASLFGVAAICENLKQSFLISHEVVADMDYGISFGVALSKKVLATITDKPNQLYYFHYQRTNILIDNIALRLTALIQKVGYEALPIPASQIADWDNQLAHLSHREIAYNAGIGWWGKNNLIVNPIFGAGVRYGTVLTNLPLSTDLPIDAEPQALSPSSRFAHSTNVPNSCGDCRRCIALCPAGAIKEGSFDKNLCKEKLKEFTRTEKIGQMICGVCIKACPIKVSGK